MRQQEPMRRISAPGDATPGIWRLEHKIPLTLACALIGQGIGLVIWATHLEARLEAVERLQQEGSGLSEKFARLDERIDALRVDISRLSRQVDRLGDREK